MKPTIAQRLKESADLSGGESACWPWLLHIDADGYGRISVRNHSERAHRATYAVLIGEIPTGLTIDHTCHNADAACQGGKGCLHRRCVNPRHLEAVSKPINTLRGKSFSAINARLNECRKGHPFSEANTYLIAGRWRQCRTCQLESVRRYQQRAQGMAS